MGPRSTRSVVPYAVVSGCLIAVLTTSAQTGPVPSGVPAATAATTTIAYEDVEPLWSEIRPYAPPALAGGAAGARAAAWAEWVRNHDTAVRDRVARGELDSLVNLWLFGTSFTTRPPARPLDVATRGGGASLAEIVDRRLADLVTALARPEANDRLRWAAQFFTEQGDRPGTPQGDSGIRERLEQARQRMLAENADYARTLGSPNAETDLFARMRPYASLYRDRGLSADTSILSSYAVDSTLELLKASRMIGGRPVRRVAIVGPGLDFINKADGHDFYPEQTIQPFAIVDSLIRVGLARAGELSVTTFDVSSRVNRHLEAARERARSGSAYVIQMPLSDAERWSRGVIGYWERAGNRVGGAAPASPAPPSVGGVRVRAVSVRPEIVLSIVPRDLNIVVERLELEESERFDLVVATNVFIYYAPFEQALAVVNIGRMLRSGGSLLSNQAVPPLAPLRRAVGHDAAVYSDRQFDPVFWYQRE